MIANLAERIRRNVSPKQIMISREGIMIRPPDKMFDLARDAELPSFPPKPTKALRRGALTSDFFPLSLLQ